MPFVSVTRLRPRRLWHAPVLVADSLRVARQLRRTAGFLGGYLAIGKGLSFWTVSVWDGAAAMVAFRNSGAHRAAMPRLIRICDEASYAHWDRAELTPPSPAEAALRLASAGKLSRVRRPSADQIAGRTWPDGMAPTPRRWLGPQSPSPGSMASTARQ
jgi:hypothetical protein